MIYSTVTNIDYNSKSDNYCDKFTYLLLIWVVSLFWICLLILCIVNAIMFIYHILIVLQFLNIITKDKTKTFKILETIRECLNFI